MLVTTVQRVLVRAVDDMRGCCACDYSIVCVS